MATFFPHETSTAIAPTSRTILSVYRHAFSQKVAEGSLRPLVLPYHIIGLLALIAYHCIPHRKNPIIYAARWPLLIFVNWFQGQILWNVSSSSFATGYMAGMISAWIIVQSWTWLIFMRPQWEAKRVQRVKIDRSKIPLSEDSNTNQSYNQKSELRQRITPGGQALVREESQQLKNDHGNNEKYRYYWQPYPDNLSERIPWVVDLILNFRGPGWNWAISPLPSLPPKVLAKLGDPIPAEAYSNMSPTGLKRFNTRRELWRSRGTRFFLSYFLLDGLKVLMMKDPYYKFGPTSYELPWYLKSLSPFTLNMYRKCLSSGTIIASLTVTFYLAPVVMSLLCGPKIFGLRAKSWYYPSAWGGFFNIYHKGLNGTWGNYWHQMFRLSFTAPSNYLTQNGYVKARSPMAMVLALIFAFGISGFLHSAGSVTIFIQSRPLDLMIFFILQGLGIVVQGVLYALFQSHLRKLPKSVRYTGNFLYSMTCLFSTGQFLADDFARGGLWLWEPIPFSPLRGLGLGESDAGWWCWEHVGVGWYTGKHWWESGIAL
ncbi:unnamed protein product [Blumeria hordei]|uniref:Wax synthase domain-containing protein n=2 Tax=Blumeria hordei TaxID=2867405 RepID=A0A383UHB2_BLUHO|nr:hypothetical protein BGHDH14_bgh01349 [Blumeria hordei DH14]SZE99669.1 unnamed protein product [Blumeria hordei]